MRSLFKVTLLSVLLLTSSNAKDLLGLATNGAISQGDVKILNNNEMKNIKGGYEIVTKVFDDQGFAVAVAWPSDMYELGAFRDPKSQKLLYLYSDATSGLCKLGVEKCYQNEATFTHSEQSRDRLMQYINALGPYTLAEGHLLSFIVKRNIGVSHLGKRYTYFTYFTAAYDLKDNSLHPISSSFNLENPIVKELRDNAQISFEKSLGGLKIY